MQLSAVKSFGGGDGPEDLLSALGRTAALDWQAKARFAVVVADAPAHGAECNDDPTDRYRQGAPGAPTLRDVMQRLADERKPVELMLCKVRRVTGTNALYFGCLLVQALMQGVQVVCVPPRAVTAWM